MYNRGNLTTAVIAGIAGVAGMANVARVDAPPDVDFYAPMGRNVGKGGGRQAHYVSKRSPKAKHSSRAKSAKRARSKFRMRSHRSGK